MNIKKTPLYEKHIKLEARIVHFAGFEMPISYSGIKEEHFAVREQVGMFDVSHMGEFLVEGKDALAFLQKTTSNDVAKLSPGQIQYSCFPNDQGGIVDDLLVYCLRENNYMLVVNGANIEKDFDWLSKQSAGFDLKLENVSDEIALIALQGPKSIELLQQLTDTDVSALAYYHFDKMTVDGIPNLLVSATGYTGEKGFELYIPPNDAPQIWEKLHSLGAVPCGLACRDTLRLEKGYCLYGNDIDDTTSPLEAGLGWITKFNKDFINKDALLAQKKEGLSKRLVGFELVDKGIARQDYPILDKEGNTIGRVTSGTQSPSLGKAIGMGYVDSRFKKTGSELFIGIRKKVVKAVVVKMPFL